MYLNRIEFWAAKKKNISFFSSFFSQAGYAFFFDFLSTISYHIYIHFLKLKGDRLDSREQSCIASCQDQYLETRDQVQKSLQQRQSNGMN